MYIEKVCIKNFRKIGANGILFNCNKGVNIILGENNTGKSAIIDALRLALSAGDYRKSLYVKPSDFHINEYGEQAKIINIDVYFNELTSEQATAFYMLTNGKNLSKAELHIEYSLYIDKKGIQRVREDIKGGHALNNVPREIYDNINLLYLAALRDAANDLRPSKNSRLANILFSVAKTDDDKERIINIFQKANEDATKDNSIQSVESIINKNLLNIEKDELQEKVKVSLVSPSFDSIASLMRIDYINNKLLKIPEKEMEDLIGELGITKVSFRGKNICKRIGKTKDLTVNLEQMFQYEEYRDLYYRLIHLAKNINSDIAQNGLGYNNILHMATSLGDLQEKPIDEEISVLLVEEPEAHLHPQLLDLLFEFFRKANNDSRIQLFITSHSPTLVAKADIDSIHIMNFHNDEGSLVSIKNTALNDIDKLNLKRYLDVTKSQMFFARRIIFVEGISEAILLSEFAKLLGKPFDKYSVEIVNISGVAFEPFAKLFKDEKNKDRLKIPCAIISDNDKCTNNDDPYCIKKDERIYSKIDVDLLANKLKNGAISYRAEKLLTYNGDEIHVELAEKTLEYELAKITENVPLLLEVLKNEHPEITSDIEKRVSPKNRNKEKNEFYETEEKIALRIWVAIHDCKGSFAQRLANEISEIESKKRTDVSFIVPEYIRRAIDTIIV